MYELYKHVCVYACVYEYYIYTCMYVCMNNIYASMYVPYLVSLHGGGVPVMFREDGLLSGADMGGSFR